MNIIKSLILFISLFSLVFSLSINFGPINQSQYTDTPSVLYYYSGNLNGIQQIEDNCYETGYSYIKNDLVPMVIINETAYLSYSFNFYSGCQLDISVIANTGIHQIVLSNIFKNYILNNRICSSPMFYDDRLKSFIFMNHNNICQYSIDADTVFTSGYKDLAPYPNPYYDMTTSTFYVASYNTSQGVNNYAIYQINEKIDNIYSIDELNLQVKLDSYQIAGFNASVVLFGNNQALSKSLLYLVNPSENTYKVLAERSYGYSLLTSANPRYVLLIDQNGYNTEMFDLELHSSNQLENTCTQVQYNNAFMTSIAATSLFTN